MHLHHFPSVASLGNPRGRPQSREREGMSLLCYSPGSLGRAVCLHQVGDQLSFDDDGDNDDDS